MTTTLDFTDTGSCHEWFGHFIPQQIIWNDTHLQIQLMCFSRDGWDCLSFIFFNPKEPSVIMDHKVPLFTHHARLCKSWDHRDWFVALQLWHSINSSSLLLPESMTCFPLHLFCACASALPLHSLTQQSVTSMTLFQLCVADRIVAEVKSTF